MSARLPSPKALVLIKALANGSPTDRAIAHSALRHESPLLALLAEIEAHADQRIFANDCANARLTTIRRLAREAMVEITGSDTNPIYPARADTPTDRWARAFPQTEGADA